MNEDVYGLTPRSAVLKRRSRRLRTAAAIVALLVIWLGYAVVTELAAELRAKSQRQAAAVIAQGGPAWSAAPAKPAKLDKPAAPVLGTAVPLDGVPAAAEAVAGALPGNFIAGPPLLVAAERNELNGGTHVPFLMAALHNGRLPGYSRRGAAGFNGGMGSSGGGGFGGGSRVESDAVDDSASGDSRVEVMGRREPQENAGGNDTGSNGNNVSNGNNGSNGNHGDGNNGSNGNHGPNGTPSANSGGNGKPPAGNPAAGPQTGDEDNDEGDGSGQAVQVVPEPGSILLALGAAAAIVRHRRRRG